MSKLFYCDYVTLGHWVWVWEPLRIRPWRQHLDEYTSIVPSNQRPIICEASVSTTASSCLNVTEDSMQQEAAVLLISLVHVRTGYNEVTDWNSTSKNLMSINSALARVKPLKLLASGCGLLTISVLDTVKSLIVILGSDLISAVVSIINGPYFLPHVSSVQYCSHVWKDGKL